MEKRKRKKSPLVHEVFLCFKNLKKKHIHINNNNSKRKEEIYGEMEKVRDGGCGEERIFVVEERKR